MNVGPHDRDDDDFLTNEPPELRRLQGTPPQDREITLSSGFILGIFFSLALLCAIVFATGYTLGRRSQQAQTSAESSATDAGFNSFKPSPQSIAVQPVTGTPSAPVPAAPSADAASGATAQPSADTPPATAPAPSHTAPAHTAPADSLPVATGSNIVQVAAVAHQEDADVLLSALARKGYAVTARSEPQDKLIHIQIGPFPTRKDADAMRQRLLVDGYNAIVK